MITLSAPQHSSQPAARVGRVVFAVEPRLDGSWRGFYFGYFSSQNRAPLQD
jgi:hypothetical protein